MAVIQLFWLLVFWSAVDVKEPKLHITMVNQLIL